MAHDLKLRVRLDDAGADPVEMVFRPSMGGSNQVTAEKLLEAVLTKLKIKYRPQNNFKMMMITGPGATTRKMLNNRKTLEVQGVKSGCEIVVCYTDTITPATDDMDTGDSTELFEDDILLKEEDYTKGLKINAGRDGVVFKGMGPNKAPVAMKELQLFNRSDVQQLHRLLNEIKIMKTSSHPAIMPLIGVITGGSTVQYPTIVTPLYGGSLQAWIDKTYDPMITATDKFHILYGIAAGMKYLHGRHIQHRDLKPANILLDDSKHPLITDFGLSKLNGSGQSINNTAACGTLWYMAPEAFSDKYGPKADVFSYGILMWAVLARENPWGTAMVSATMHRKNLENQKRPRPLPKTAAAAPLVELMERCWEQESQKRPSFDEIVQILETDPRMENLRNTGGRFAAYRKLIDQAVKTTATAVAEIEKRAGTVNSPWHDMSDRALAHHCSEGKPEALIEFGRRCELGTATTEPDLSMAWDCYKRAAQAGSGDGCFLLARCYRYGIGVAKDEVAAKVMYDKAKALSSPLMASVPGEDAE